MRAFVGIVIAVFCLLTILTTLVPYAPAQAEAAQFFDAATIERGEQYALERRALFWAATAVELGVLLGLGLTGAGRWLAARTHPRGSWLGAVLGIGAVCFLAQQFAKLPFAVARFELTHAWGMSTQAFGAWLTDYLVALGVEAVAGALMLAGLYALLRYTPRFWWLLATLGAAVCGAAFAFLMPIVIAPLFNTFTPLSETRWAGLESSVRNLTLAAGVPVQDILVMDASRQGKHTNAYFTGFGSTRRIVLYDTLLANHTPPEVESILADELGHWVHQHILLGLALAMPAALVGFLALGAVLRRVQGRTPWRLNGLADPAGIPLVLLCAYLGSWLALPVENAVSRVFERQADAMSLQLAGQPDAFIAAEEKLAKDNLGNVAPTPWNVWIFSTHPPAVERIEMGKRWRAEHGPHSGSRTIP